MGSCQPFLPVLLILFLALIVAPIEIYSVNVDGFTDDIYDFLVIMFPVLFLASADVFCICFLQSKAQERVLLTISALRLSLFHSVLLCPYALNIIIYCFFSTNTRGSPLGSSMPLWFIGFKMEE